jgi:DNA-binding LacI/PurR family transcriptional regulator
MGMRHLRIQSAPEQVAAYLSEGLATGAWRGDMPGVLALSRELRVNHKTVEAALSLLERKGLLKSQGARRPRIITKVADDGVTRSLRIGMLSYDETDLRNDVIVELRHVLHEAGHVPFVAKRLLIDIGMDTRKLASEVRRQPADAWLAVAGPMETLEWFATTEIPVFALFGRFRRLPVAGCAPDKTAAYTAAVRTLAARGHRRIVLLSRLQQRLPEPSLSVRTFLKALAAEGIGTSDYNCPLWENTREDFQRCLESLFGASPPTALVVQETLLFGAVQQFIEARGIRVPQDVSLVCTDYDPSFVWRIPTVAHIHWDSGPLVRRVARWANQIAVGKDDRGQLLTKAQFVNGGTIGPASG